MRDGLPILPSASGLMPQSGKAELSAARSGVEIDPVVWDRFWSKVDVSGGPDACWPWTRADNGNGYGVVRINKIQHYVHRWAYEACVGPIPHGLQILHQCDSRRCCNPQHLSVGTAADNIADMVAKGRHFRGEAKSRVMRISAARGERHGLVKHPERRPRGERSGQAKLTTVGIEQILASDRAGQNRRAIAKQFGISYCQVWRIVTGRTWQHITAGDVA